MKNKNENKKIEAGKPKGVRTMVKGKFALLSVLILSVFMIFPVMASALPTNKQSIDPFGNTLDQENFTIFATGTPTTSVQEPRFRVINGNVYMSIGTPRVIDTRTLLLDFDTAVSTATDIYLDTSTTTFATEMQTSEYYSGTDTHIFVDLNNVLFHEGEALNYLKPDPDNWPLFSGTQILGTLKSRATGIALTTSDLSYVNALTGEVGPNRNIANGYFGFTTTIGTLNLNPVPEIPAGAALPLMALVGMGIYWMRGRVRVKA